MRLQKLLDYVQENAKSLRDLADVHAIRTSEPGDVYRNSLIRQIRNRYQDEAIAADRASVFDN